MLVLQSHLKLQKLQPRCLVKMEKAQNLCVCVWEKYCVQSWNYLWFQASMKDFRTCLLLSHRATATYQAFQFLRLLHQYNPIQLISILVRNYHFDGVEVLKDRRSFQRWKGRMTAQLVVII